MANQATQINPRFILIGDLINSTEDITLGSGFILRKPNLNELPRIQMQLKKVIDLVVPESINRYESNKIQVAEHRWRFDRIENKNDFKYRIIQVPETFAQLNIHEVGHLILNLTKLDLNLIYIFETDLVTSVHNTSKVFNYFNSNGMNFELINLSNELIEDFKKTISLVLDIQPRIGSYNSLRKSIIDFSNHKEISELSPFKIIAIISSLELLLTDGSHDRINSINKQLQTKINLLNNISEEPIDFTDFINGPDTLTLEKVIEAIYTYRNKVAHGDFIEFKKSLTILEHIEFKDLVRFLIRLSQVVFKEALIRPDLIVDLKKC